MHRSCIPIYVAFNCQIQRNLKVKFKEGSPSIHPSIFYPLEPFEMVGAQESIPARKGLFKFWWDICVCCLWNPENCLVLTYESFQTTKQVHKLDLSICLSCCTFTSLLHSDSSSHVYVLFIKVRSSCSDIINLKQTAFHVSCLLISHIRTWQLSFLLSHL